MHVAIEALGRPDLRRLIEGHLAEMRASSPPESTHALTVPELAENDVTLWTARDDGLLLGCGALKPLGRVSGEIKTMRTTPEARRRGVATAILAAIVTEARARGYTSLHLETGAHEPFAPARRLYARHGFRPCGPFAQYTDDPLSAFLALDLTTGPDSAAGHPDHRAVVSDFR